jgi:hypothetical protein
VSIVDVTQSGPAPQAESVSGVTDVVANDLAAGVAITGLRSNRLDTARSRR